ncbi:MAG: hypothetical protein ACYC5I_08355 [Coriobacteriia bacterium]
MNSTRTWSIVALVTSALLILSGLSFVVMYFVSAVVERVGESDQSLLFWYLPILMIGVIGVLIGIGAGILGVLGIRKTKGVTRD